MLNRLLMKQLNKHLRMLHEFELNPCVTVMDLSNDT